MRIRAESREDWAAIAAVTEAAFGSARESRMIDAIRASDGFVPELSLVAEDDGQVVGHALLSYVELEGPSADARGEPLVLVLGHPGYYPRFGFRPASELGITPPDPEIPYDAFMAIPLRAYDPALRGQVIFPPAYAAEGLE